MKYLFLLFIFTTACRSWAPGEKEAINVIHTYAESQKERGLELFGSGMSMPDLIQTLNVTFYSKNHLQPEEAKNLLLQSGDEFLLLINNDKPLRPYLKRYPFTYDNLKLAIYFGDETRMFYCPPDVATINLNKLGITYSFYNPVTDRLFR